MCALRALHVLFPTFNIGVQLPLPFRTLWKQWQTDDTQAVVDFEHKRHVHKMKFVEALVTEWKLTVSGFCCCFCCLFVVR